jgi:hypothetical protein
MFVLLIGVDYRWFEQVGALGCVKKDGSFGGFFSYEGLNKDVGKRAMTTGYIC